MDTYDEIRVSPGPWHAETCATAGAEMVPEEYCLNTMTDAPTIPAVYDREKNEIKVTSKDDGHAFEVTCADDLPSTGVLFECGVFVHLSDNDEYDAEFMKQLDGDLLLYETPIHRCLTREFAQESFEQTAAWWRSVRQERSREDAELILKALYKLSTMPYPGPGMSTSNSRVRAMFESKANPDTDVHAIVHTLKSFEYGVVAFVNATEGPSGQWAGNSREGTVAVIGRDCIRYCKMQPRALSVHRKRVPAETATVTASGGANSEAPTRPSRVALLRRGKSDTDNGRKGVRKDKRGRGRRGLAHGSQGQQQQKRSLYLDRLRKLDEPPLPQWQHSTRRQELAKLMSDAVPSVGDLRREDRGVSE